MDFRQYFSFIIAISLSAPLFAITQIRLADHNLKTYLTDQAPEMDRVELETKLVDENLRRFQDQYTTFLFSEAEFTESDDPTVSSWTKQGAIGFKKNFGYGIDGSLAYIFRREKLSPYTPGGFGNMSVYTPLIHSEVSIDLWKNFLGSLEYSQAEYINQLVRQSEIKKRLDTKKFHMKLRIIYWHLAFQKRRVEIFGELVKTTRRAYQQMKARLRDNVADPGDVANMAANLSSAEADHRAAIIQRNFIERELKTAIPVLQKYDIAIAADYSTIRSRVLKCVTCAKKMGRMKNIPYEYTEYDELITALNESLSIKSKDLETYDDIDIKLQINGDFLGLDQKSGEAINQSLSAENSAYSALLSFTMPLGNMHKTKRLILNNEARSTRINTARISADFHAAHQNVQRNFGPLEQVVSLYHKSIREQTKAFDDTNKKLQQGRISVIDYITDQNSLLASKLQVLQIEEQIITEMLKYYITFNLVPCEFNRI